MSESGGELTRSEREALRRAVESRRVQPDNQPWSLIGLGAVLAVLGLGAATLTGSEVMTLIGLAVLGLGVVVIGIGVVAEGIRIGARWARYDRGE